MAAVDCSSARRRARSFALAVWTSWWLPSPPCATRPSPFIDAHVNEAVSKRAHRRVGIGDHLRLLVADELDVHVPALLGDAQDVLVVLGVVAVHSDQLGAVLRLVDDLAVDRLEPLPEDAEELGQDGHCPPVACGDVAPELAPEPVGDDGEEVAGVQQQRPGVLVLGVQGHVHLVPPLRQRDFRLLQVPLHLAGA